MVKLGNKWLYSLPPKIKQHYRQCRLSSSFILNMKCSNPKSLGLSQFFMDQELLQGSSIVSMTQPINRAINYQNNCGIPLKSSRRIWFAQFFTHDSRTGVKVLSLVHYLTNFTLYTKKATNDCGLPIKKTALKVFFIFCAQYEVQESQEFKLAPIFQPTVQDLLQFSRLLDSRCRNSRRIGLPNFPILV